MGLCHAYLEGAAYGFFGSTTIAYGPATGNGEADLICQYFLQAMKAGATLGQATLDARLKFVLTSGPLSPVGLKTLAQFLLLGDPAIAPVAGSGAGPAQKKAPGGKFFAAAAGDDESVLQQKAKQAATRIRETVGVAGSPSATTSMASAPPELRAIASELGFGEATLKTFPILPPLAAAEAKAFIEPQVSGGVFHVLMKPGGAETKAIQPGIRTITLLVAREEHGKIVSVDKLSSR
jgi:hypothetical protein